MANARRTSLTNFENTKAFRACCKCMGADKIHQSVVRVLAPALYRVTRVCYSFLSSIGCYSPKPRRWRRKRRRRRGRAWRVKTRTPHNYVRNKVNFTKQFGAIKSTYTILVLSGHDSDKSNISALLKIAPLIKQERPGLVLLYVISTRLLGILPQLFLNQFFVLRIGCILGSKQGLQSRRSTIDLFGLRFTTAGTDAGSALGRAMAQLCTSFLALLMCLI